MEVHRVHWKSIAGGLFVLCIFFMTGDVKAMDTTFSLQPSPQSFIIQDGTLTLGKAVQLVFGKSVDDDTKNCFIEILEKNGIVGCKQADIEYPTIYLGTRLDLLPENISHKQTVEDFPEQGYKILINDKLKQVSLVGNDRDGLFYAMQTFSQILTKSAGKLPNGEIRDYPIIKKRGVIEGFYGKPWTQKDRLDQFRFYGEQKINTYIYAPKDDPYHREKWRDPYPKVEMQQLQELITAAEKNHVDFVFALSPGLNMVFDGKAGDKDLQLLIDKFELLYNMGVHSFAVYFDDIKNKDGAKQAYVLNEVNKRFVKKHDNIEPLITVPTEYYTADMVENNQVKPYTADFAKHLSKDIVVMYTGEGVVCEGILRESLQQVEEIYARKMALWWNYPVSDYLKSKLALGPITGIEDTAGENLQMFIMNPMEHANLSKITLATGADYAWNPKQYDYNKAWQQAIKEQYGKQAESMELFAYHSRRMENSWAHVGLADAPDVRKHMDTLFQKLQTGQDCSFTINLLQQDFFDMKTASENLQTQLPKQDKEECLPQLKLFEQLAEADLIALQMLEANCNEQKFLYQKYRADLLTKKKNLPPETVVQISEKVARSFIDEALAYKLITK